MTFASRLRMRRGVGGEMAVLRLMSDIHVGDDVIFRGRVYSVRGLSPMSASPRRALLEDLETGENVEAHLDELGTPESAAHFQAPPESAAHFQAMRGPASRERSAAKPPSS